MDKLTELLTALAEKLGTTSEYLFSVLVKQSQVVFFQDIIGIFVMILFIVAYLFYARYCYKNWEKMYENDNDIGHIFGLIIGGTVIAVLIIAITTVVNEMITIQMNPDFWALDYILQMLN